MELVRIGTRGSRLALGQAQWVRDQLAVRYPDTAFEVQVIDRGAGPNHIRAVSPAAEGSGSDTQWLLEAVSNGVVDAGVHSLKDLPVRLPDDQVIAAIPPRGPAEEILVSKRRRVFTQLEPHALVGTMSERRAGITRHLRPDLDVAEVRGNVDTRIRKLFDTRTYDALIMARAGVARLGLEDYVTEVLPMETWLPAPGQGALAVTAAGANVPLLSIISSLTCPDTWAAVRAERALLGALQGGCHAPVGAHAVVRGGQLVLRGLVVRPDGQAMWREQADGAVERAADIGNEMADKLLLSGGQELADALLAGLHPTRSR